MAGRATKPARVTGSRRSRDGDLRSAFARFVEQSSVLRTVAFIAAVSWTGGCSEEAAPVTAAKAFASAAQRGDAKSMLGLVDADAVRYLEDSAERASDQIGGRRNVEPHEMLQIIDVDPKFQVARAELVSSTEASATVKLMGADGSEHSLDLLLQEGQWRVRVPVPTRPASNS